MADLMVTGKTGSSKAGLGENGAQHQPAVYFSAKPRKYELRTTHKNSHGLDVSGMWKHIHRLQRITQRVHQYAGITRQ